MFSQQQELIFHSHKLLFNLVYVWGIIPTQHTCLSLISVKLTHEEQCWEGTILTRWYAVWDGNPSRLLAIWLSLLLAWWQVMIYPQWMTIYPKFHYVLGVGISMDVQFEQYIPQKIVIMISSLPSHYLKMGNLPKM